ncbi:MAG: N-acetylmuramoyl-L-alanine amidase [Planctomycetota bacterium]|nr:N-acetylmuramoyl-L-alanine amidase [Planctomycetota bacterium]
MQEGLTRRELIAAGAALLLAGCARHRGGLSARPSESQIITPDHPHYATPIAAPDGLWYRVAKGDTLSGISRRSGVPVKTIAGDNRLASSLIKPGQRLWLPGVHHLETDPLAVAQAKQAKRIQRAVAGDYQLVPRSEWTRTKPRSNYKKMGKVTRITLHHTGEHKGMVGKSDVEIVRMIERYHRDGRKWSAIGYHYLVGRDGRIYEGRPAWIQGAHTSKANSNNLGISCIGDFHHHLPTEAQMGALIAFLGNRRTHYGVGRTRVYGHRDLSPSICPGDTLYGWLKGYKRG